MAKYQTVFKRYEKKYLVSKENCNAFIAAIEDKVCPDKYGKSTVCNIYFDTPDYRLIRASIEKPVFKEKLRLRSYGVPDESSHVFVELKKKYKGVVYKRRIRMPYRDAVLYLMKGVRPKEANEQILAELDYFISYYPKIRPSVSLFYDRVAFYAKDNKEIRITFDSNIRFRTKNLDLSRGDEGYQLLNKDLAVMEIKCLGAMPLWISKELDRLQIYPASYSKYGEVYKLLHNQMNLNKNGG